MRIQVIVILFALVFYTLLRSDAQKKEPVLIHGVLYADRPQVKKNYDKPGNYEMAITLNKNTLYEGENMTIEIFLTGYGEITQSKIYSTFSDSIIDREASTASTSFKFVGDSLIWGVDEYFIDQYNLLQLSGGIQYKDKDGYRYSSQYIDAIADTNALGIITEGKSRNAPITFRLKLKDKVRPGQYLATFYYTYFNGAEWKTAKSEVPIKVNSFLEQHSVFFYSLGLIIGLLSLLPVFELIVDYYKKFLSKKKKEEYENKRRF